MTIDTPNSLLASQTKQHAAFLRCAQIQTLHQGEQHPGSKFDEESVHFLCVGTLSLTQFWSDSDVPVLSLEQTYHVAKNKIPVLLPTLTQEFVLNAVTDAALVSLGKQDCRSLLGTSRYFRAMVFAATAEGIAQASKGLDELNAEEAITFLHSQRRPLELHRMSVQWLLQLQKGKPQ
ncbi:hypothetical protein [Roseovarius rhodophyticola]|uniref:Uncharacterized protein n=1 Tax=Roseovarius rhodophyticola TaxID=3080827 RepID=A0ABZ2TE95_9RHOB|nr:hypothetical protein [Roseovarius sp. W115]MDV2928277.1 hypothetical protein [Roseovarius sp. W115]